MEKRLFVSRAITLIPLILALACGRYANTPDDAETPVASSSKDIVSFGIVSPVNGDGSIDETSRRMTVTVPTGTDVSRLIARFVSTGVSTTVNGIEQVSGTTVNDFTHPVTYKVTAADGSTKAYSAVVAIGESTGTAYPLAQGPTGRYLVDQAGEPVLMTGDAPWSLIVQLGDDDVKTYLDSRAAMGFNTILVNLIEHKFADNAPKNIFGDSPFIGTAFQSAPNESYFTHADFVIQQAALRGILVLLAPAYVGYNGEDEGWCAEMQAATDEQMKDWGRFVGARYADQPNILWVIGDDCAPERVRSKLQAVVSGIIERDSSHLMTAHNGPGSTAVAAWGSPIPSWLTVNNVYEYSNPLTPAAQTAYNAGIPFFEIESNYESENSSTPQQIRAQAYDTILSGGFGEVFGNSPMWSFGSGWKSQLNSTGTVSMRNLGKLFRSRDWHLLRPDDTIVTAGAESGSTATVSAGASDGRTCIVYLPTQRTITVDLEKVSGSTAHLWWYDVSEGVSADAGTYSTAGTRSLAPSSAGDWILVMDDASYSFPLPGNQ